MWRQKETSEFFSFLQDANIRLEKIVDKAQLSLAQGSNVEN